ncbi:MAG: murein biosynthesis integral membrane protein MurJ [Candidatus Omnitrophota bacterium]
MSDKAIVKSAGVIGGATSLSRVLGFFRDIIIAAFLGTGAAAQAFVVAFRIPNLIRNLAGEGAANSAVVPVLTECLQRDKADFRRLACLLFALVAIVLAAIVFLGLVFAPSIVRFIAPGFAANGDKFILTTRLTRLMFPYLFLVGLSALAMGVLNSRRYFAIPALGPCLFNLALIGGGLIALSRGRDVMVLGWAVLVGGALQLGIQIPLLRREAFYSLDLCWRGDITERVKRRVKEIGCLLLPRMLGSGVYLLNIFVDTVLASLAWIVGDGGVAAIYYASRLIQLPLAIFGFAFSQAALPVMSAYAARGEKGRLRQSLYFTLKRVFLFIIPSAVGLAMLAGPIINALFERGKFGPYSTAITSSALSFYALGLPAYAAGKILSSCFYALKDTRSPVKSAGISLLVNIAFNLFFIGKMKIAGLALASSLAAFVNVVILYKMLIKKIGLGGVDYRALFGFVLRIILSAAVMVGFIWFIRPFLIGFSPVLGLAVVIFAAGGVFFAAAAILKCLH